MARCSEAAELLQGMRDEIAALHQRLAAHDAAAGAASEVVNATSVLPLQSPWSCWGFWKPLMRIAKLSTAGSPINKASCATRPAFVTIFRFDYCGAIFSNVQRMSCFSAVPLVHAYHMNLLRPWVKLSHLCHRVVEYCCFIARPQIAKIQLADRHAAELAASGAVAHRHQRALTAIAHLIAAASFSTTAKLQIGATRTVAEIRTADDVTAPSTHSKQAASISSASGSTVRRSNGSLSGSLSDSSPAHQGGVGDIIGDEVHERKVFTTGPQLGISSTMAAKKHTSPKPVFENPMYEKSIISSPDIR